nr:MucR family transcriptional regulator [Sphingomonas melonis]
MKENEMFERNGNVVALATGLTVAWLRNSNNRVSAADVPAFLNSMYATITSLATGQAADAERVEFAEEYVPAVSIRKSLASPDHIISLIDGKPYRTLRRHLSSQGLTPDDYRKRYNLKADYPMVAPAYSAARQEMAKKIGLGRKPGRRKSAAGEAKPSKVSQAKAAAKAHLGGTAD